MAENTGRKVYVTLKKVVDGGPRDGEPLDSGNRLASVTGNPQHTKDNSPEDGDYVEPSDDLTMCPLNDFSFVPVTGAALSTAYDSNEITVIGIQGTAAIAVLGGGSYSKNGGAFTSTSGTVANGDEVIVRNTSAATSATTNNMTLKIGSVLRQFTITTA